MKIIILFIIIKVASSNLIDEFNNNTKQDLDNLIVDGKKYII